MTAAEAFSAARAALEERAKELDLIPVKEARDTANQYRCAASQLAQFQEAIGVLTRPTEQLLSYAREELQRERAKAGAR